MARAVDTSSAAPYFHFMAEIVHLDADRPDPEVIRRACAVLEAGELVGVPTETVYGIACASEYIEALYRAKERDRGKPVARLAASLKQVAALGANFGKAGKALASTYWPGPLTLVLNTPEGTTGFRVPDHGIPLALARAFGRPIALTSANKSGETDALNAQEAFQCLETAVPLFLESFQPLEPTGSDFRASAFAEATADRSPCPSTVLLCTQNETKILREGAVPAQELGIK
ncbi:MAG TPA: L-threonylcarbamoyladenylate synthase [Tichowtungia sp.]|nr:L-threonylcarbamoyladenylate synthase [Tichowtungia sp.]